MLGYREGSGRPSLALGLDERGRKSSFLGLDPLPQSVSQKPQSLKESRANEALKLTGYQELFPTTNGRRISAKKKKKLKEKQYDCTVSKYLLQGIF